jgi:hypothetical protein
MNKDTFRLTHFESDSEFITDSPYKLLAWSIAVEFYDYDSSTANKISELCFEFYISFLNNVNGIDLIDFICEQYDSLPNDFKEIKNLLVSHLY